MHDGADAQSLKALLGLNSVAGNIGLSCVSTFIEEGREERTLKDYARPVTDWSFPLFRLLATSSDQRRWWFRCYPKPMQEHPW